MELQLELGKCYIRNDGKITGPIEGNYTGDKDLRHTYKFIDPKSSFTYTSAGRILENSPLGPYDLVSEYKVEGLSDIRSGPDIQIWA